MTDPSAEPAEIRPVSKKIVIGEAVWLALFGATWAAAQVFAQADHNSAIAGGTAFAVSGVLLFGWLWRAQASRSGRIGMWATALALLIIVGGVAMAAVGATLAFLAGSTATKTPPTSGPTSGPTTPPSAAPGVKVRFYVPAIDDRRIEAGSELDLSGTVEGLAPGHKLFIISSTKKSESLFAVAGTGARESDAKSFAAADRDGPWSAHDGGVGSKKDEAGTPFKFTPYDADATCAEELEQVIRNSTGKAHRIEETLPSGCVAILKSEITVTLDAAKGR
ncbi:hypothetical protein [Paractinoplanes ferrugineus]|uniref:hypothetical protein n=1 Tax=Paractinoplanes ferrugineus TaxID=113564 RepID=UPI001942E711|nr:hypothetical protein [Actinoplanes ferrugineus]